MRRSTAAIAVAWAVVLAGIAALPLGGCNRDRPDAIQVAAAAWRLERPVPILSLEKDRDPVSLALRIPRRQLINEIVLRSGEIRFTIGACARIGKSGRFYETELYTDGVPLDRAWAREEEDGGNPPMPGFVEVFAVMPRSYAGSFEGSPVCGVFENERWGFSATRSNIVRLPPLAGARPAM